ncbi:hypothetical protein [Nostocoides sp. Soil756]|uniref:hypothetical protein n=1 Tax=Nostocoides sp. Soil756 TaxID=1736399 RepID=UPI0006F5AC99|nr:hypothetical protein [Tetrasphaera sp. Soil756]KRE63393.1 hypothetical protein ASG78_00290 [Tetrasphaera sp. Soil756]
MSGSEVVERARELIEQGRTWQARDLLVEHVGSERDAPALTLLGHVHHGMGDLPRAGAAWFTTGVRGPEADEAVAAWREQSADDFAVMWRSIPAPFRDEPRPPRLEALRARALTSDPDLDKPTSPLLPDGAGPDAVVAQEVPGDEEESSGLDGAQVIGWIVAALFVVCAVIGAVTVLNWLVPGG